MTFATCPAATVIDVNGAKFTAFNGADGRHRHVRHQRHRRCRCDRVLRGAGGLDRCARAGQVTACNLAGTDRSRERRGGRRVNINGRTFTATARATGVIGDFSISGNDTADGDALVARSRPTRR
jgi:hypothetical protein